MLRLLLMYGAGEFITSGSVLAMAIVLMAIRQKLTPIHCDYHNINFHSNRISKGQKSVVLKTFFRGFCFCLQQCFYFGATFTEVVLTFDFFRTNEQSGII